MKKLVIGNMVMWIVVLIINLVNFRYTIILLPICLIISVVTLFIYFTHAYWIIEMLGIIVGAIMLSKAINESSLESLMYFLISIVSFSVSVIKLIASLLKKKKRGEG